MAYFAGLSLPMPSLGGNGHFKTESAVFGTAHTRKRLSSMKKGIKNAFKKTFRLKTKGQAKVPQVVSGLLSSTHQVPHTGNSGIKSSIAAEPQCSLVAEGDAPDVEAGRNIADSLSIVGLNDSIYEVDMSEFSYLSDEISDQGEAIPQSASTTSLCQLILGEKADGPQTEANQDSIAVENGNAEADDILDIVNLYLADADEIDIEAFLAATAEAIAERVRERARAQIILDRAKTLVQLTSAEETKTSASHAEGNVGRSTFTSTNAGATADTTCIIAAPTPVYPPGFHNRNWMVDLDEEDSESSDDSVITCIHDGLTPATTFGDISWPSLAFHLADGIDTSPRLLDGENEKRSSDALASQCRTAAAMNGWDVPTAISKVIWGPDEDGELTALFGVVADGAAYTMKEICDAQRRRADAL
ncbi:hypothetical protein B0H67DRAFT_551671 [Lasiosphaeris hirsuta]|uniref:Uncharacterized protein n=1 Tax=Lasiosphaeris hirsuta TaxID=260670 RepID=A0AA40ANU7_9PEZI|nr:hypothetical protein B0H67DRAFT_551671 [Lasiosphaeris hirsuta]